MNKNKVCQKQVWCLGGKLCQTISDIDIKDKLYGNDKQSAFMAQIINR